MYLCNEPSSAYDHTNDHRLRIDQRTSQDRNMIFNSQSLVRSRLDARFPHGNKTLSSRLFQKFRSEVRFNVEESLWQLLYYPVSEALISSETWLHGRYVQSVPLKTDIGRDLVP